MHHDAIPAEILCPSFWHQSVCVYTVMVGASWSGREHDSRVLLDSEPAHFLGALSERGAWQL